MPSRGRFPRFLGLLVLGFSFVGIISFQIFKERRIATSAITEKDFQILEMENSLQEQMKVASQREEERNFAQAKLMEFERVSKTALDSLHAKEQELESIKVEYQNAVDQFRALKKVVEQKEVEILDVRGKLQMVSFEKAKESAQQFSSEQHREEIESRQADEHKPPDEAGLVDRKRTTELEEQHADEIEAVTATEKEMIERSKPKADGQAISESLKSVIQDTSKLRDSSELGGGQYEQAEVRHNANEKEGDGTSQDGDLNEVRNLDAESHNGDLEHADRQLTVR